MRKLLKKRSLKKNKRGLRRNREKSEKIKGKMKVNHLEKEKKVKKANR